MLISKKKNAEIPFTPSYLEHCKNLHKYRTVDLSWVHREKAKFLLHAINKGADQKRGLEVIKLEFILKFKIKHNDWLLADMSASSQSLRFIWVWEWTHVRKQPIIVFYFEFENELKFYNLQARSASLLSLSGTLYSLTSWIQNINILASLCSWGGWFESDLVANPTGVHTSDLGCTPWGYIMGLPWSLAHHDI